MPNKPKRPGVEAAMNLVALDSTRVWEKIEANFENVCATIPNLSDLQAQIRELSKAKKTFFTKSDLDTVVLWKHAVGKNRIYNIKYLNSNSEESVVKHSKAAIELSNKIDAKGCLEDDGSISHAGRSGMQNAISELSKLWGVGPATASAILSISRPDVFCFLFDECIDTFEKQRDYKMSNYLRVNTRCMQLARDLGDGWTTSRVAQTIWTAARFLAIHGRDLTIEDSNTDNDTNDESLDDNIVHGDDHSTEKNNTKRQRTE